MSRNQRSTIHNLINSHPPVPPLFGTVVENGRTYAYLEDYIYPFPIDELEAAALDMFHNFIYKFALRGEKLYNADLVRCPVGNGPRQVLDIGFGNGNWCYDMAKRHPEMHVHGIDFFARLPEPKPNCSFYPVNFANDSWSNFQDGAFDFVRAARLCGSIASNDAREKIESVADWNHLHRQIHRYLKPGGFVEHVEIDWTPRLMKGHQCPPAAIPLFEWWHYVQKASESRGVDMAYPDKMKEMLDDAGFSISSHEIIEIPLRRDPGDPWEKHMVEFFLLSLAMGARQDLPMSTVEGLGMSLLTREAGRSVEEAHRLCASVRSVFYTEGLGKDLPVYYNLHILTARKRKI